MRYTLAVVSTAALLILAGIAVFSSALPAGAHDFWINHSGYKSPTDGSHCCGQNDCKLIPEADVKITQSGYELSTGEVVPFSEAQQSEDRDYWRCHRYDGSRRCFFAPQPGS